MIVDVHVMPNAAKTQIQGLHDGALRVRLHAPPVDGKANLALQAWLAATLGIPQIGRGTAARDDGATQAAARGCQPCGAGRLGAPAAWRLKDAAPQAPKACGETV